MKLMKLAMDLLAIGGIAAMQYQASGSKLGACIAAIVVGAYGIWSFTDGCRHERGLIK